MIRRLLRTSTNLKKLDVRGLQRITPEGLQVQINRTLSKLPRDVTHRWPSVAWHLFKIGLHDTSSSTKLSEKQGHQQLFDPSALGACLWHLFNCFCLPLLLLLTQSFWKFIQESFNFCSAEFTSNFSYGIVFLGHTRYICSDVSCHSAGNIFYDVMCREKPWPNTRESSFLDIPVVINEKKISYLWKTFQWRVVNQNQCIHNNRPYLKENTCSLKRSILLRSLLAGGWWDISGPITERCRVKPLQFEPTLPTRSEISSSSESFTNFVFNWL